MVAIPFGKQLTGIGICIFINHGWGYGNQWICFNNNRFVKIRSLSVTDQALWLAILGELINTMNCHTCFNRNMFLCSLSLSYYSNIPSYEQMWIISTNVVRWSWQTSGKDHYNKHNVKEYYPGVRHIVFLFIYSVVLRCGR